MLLVFGFQCGSHIDKSLVESFILAVSFWMIRFCLHLSDVGKFAQFFDQLGHEITPLDS